MNKEQRELLHRIDRQFEEATRNPPEIELRQLRIVDERCAKRQNQGRKHWSMEGLAIKVAGGANPGFSAGREIEGG